MVPSSAFGCPAPSSIFSGRIPTATCPVRPASASGRTRTSGPRRRRTVSVPLTVPAIRFEAPRLAARELARLALLHPFEPHDAQHLAHAAAERLAANRAPPQAEGDVLEHGQMREQRVGLEDGVDVALVGRQPAHLALAEVDPSLGGLLEAA